MVVEELSQALQTFLRRCGRGVSLGSVAHGESGERDRLEERIPLLGSNSRKQSTRRRYIGNGLSRDAQPHATRHDQFAAGLQMTSRVNGTRNVSDHSLIFSA